MLENEPAPMSRIPVLPTLVLSGCLWAACLPQVGPPLDGGESPADSGTADGGASCSDGVRDGAETDLDCGGPCAPCANTLHCARATDCVSGRCSATTCQPPASVCNANYSGCTSFTDLTLAANPTVRFPVGGDRYSPDCIRVKLGQSVTFEGTFFSHPLAQGCGPVPALLEASTNNTFTVTFDQGLGVYGYFCTQHGSQSGSGMAGAIEVVP